MSSQVLGMPGTRTLKRSQGDGKNSRKTGTWIIAGSQKHELHSYQWIFKHKSTVVGLEGAATWISTIQSGTGLPQLAIPQIRHIPSHTVYPCTLHTPHYS